MSKEVVVVIRDGVIDRVFCSDPETVVTVINFGIGDDHIYSGLEQYVYPTQEWDMAEIAEIADEYNAQVARYVNPQCIKCKEEEKKQ